VLFVFAFFSVMSWDFIMALNPSWTSALFAGTATRRRS